MTSLDLAKVVVARSANAKENMVIIEQIWQEGNEGERLGVAELINSAQRIAHKKEYSFLMYNCRHFVSELLNEL